MVFIITFSSFDVEGSSKFSELISEFIVLKEECMLYFPISASNRMLFIWCCATSLARTSVIFFNRMATCSAKTVNSSRHDEISWNRGKKRSWHRRTECSTNESCEESFEHDAYHMIDRSLETPCTLCNALRTSFQEF